MEKRVLSTVAECPDCGRKFALNGPVVIGQEVVCPHCDADLEIIETDPIELDWAYGEDDDEWEDEEEEEED